jgi:hypothetical protein
MNFSDYLLESIEHYYRSKSKYCLGSKTKYNYSLHFRDEKKLPTISGLDYNKFLFYIEFSNIKSQRAILFGIVKDSSHLQVNFYNKFDPSDNYKSTNKIGELYLVSNMINNGVSLHLLNIIYEFMENKYFDQDDPFYRIAIN